MSLNEFTPQLLLGLMGGGFASSVISLFNSAARRADYLEKQPQKL
jgi:hypothetical protein